MTLALGATFPLALAGRRAAARRDGRRGRDAARVYTANTLGAIAGALAAGFALMPALGLRSTFQTAAIVGALGGAGLPGGGAARSTTERTANDERDAERRERRRRRSRSSCRRPSRSPRSRRSSSLPPWDRELLASGAYKYAPYLGADDLETVLRAGTLEYYKEGAAATVSVRRLTGTTSLAIDGKVDASNAGDMLTQRLLGLLPVLLHGNAQRHLHHRPRQRRHRRLGARRRHRRAAPTSSRSRRRSSRRRTSSIARTAARSRSPASG